MWSAHHDLLWIAGLGSLLFGLIAVPLTALVPVSSELLVTAFINLAVVCNYPHYAVTYQLLWRERARARSSWTWLLASTPIAVAVIVYAAFFDRALIGLVNRVYLTWSAYHYAAQHFGIASMYQARERRPLAPREKRALQVGFVAVALHIMLLLNMKHGLGATEIAFGAKRADAFESLLPYSAHPLAVGAVALGLGAFALSEVWHRRRTGSGLSREARTLFVANFSWFVLPYVHLPGKVGPWTGESVSTWLPYALPFFHCTQYLAVSGWRARTTGAIKPVYYFIGLMVLGFLLFEGGMYGISRLSHIGQAQALILVPAVINIHHFFLDGIIWKTRRRPAAKEQRRAPEVPARRAA